MKATTSNLKKFLAKYGITVGGYAGSYGSTIEENREVCIQEFTNLFLGGAGRLRHNGDNVPCVSAVINSAMIQGNDSYFGDDPSVLIPLVPKIVGTAPTYERGKYLLRKESDPAYRKAETKRGKLVTAFEEKHLDENPTFAEFKKLIRDLVNA